MSRTVRNAPPSANERLLLDKYMPLVRRIAFALQTMRPAVLDQDDVIQDGMIGLLRAIRSNHAQGSDAQFASFAGLNIRGAIIDGYRSVGAISRSDYDHAKKTRQALAAGHDVPGDERASAEHLFAMAWSPAVPIEPGADDALPLHDPFPGPEQRAVSNQLLRLAVDQLQRASVRDRSIFIACELQDEKHAAVARRYKLSPGRVSQILKQVRHDILLALA